MARTVTAGGRRGFRRCNPEVTGKNPMGNLDIYLRGRLYPTGWTGTHYLRLPDNAEPLAVLPGP
jgi:hypothetical protein